MIDIAVIVALVSMGISQSNIILWFDVYTTDLINKALGGE